MRRFGRNWFGNVRPPAPRRAERRRGRLFLEPLESRTLLASGTGTFASPFGISPTGTLSPEPISSTPVYALVSLGSSGSLTAQVQPLTGGVVPKLSLLRSDGTVLAQSAGQAGSLNDLITQSLPAGVYLLETESLNGSSGTVSLTTNFKSGNLPSSDLPVGMNPVTMVTADLGNGHLDLITADFGTVSDPGTTISVLLGNGDGSFQPAHSYPVGANPDAIVVGDFGNGHLDVAVANYGSGTVSVLLGNGTGTLSLAQTYVIGSKPQALVAANFGNGHLDLATADFGTGTISVLLGNGHGTFQNAQEYHVGVGLDALVAGDFGNGHIDLAAADTGIRDSDNAVIGTPAVVVLRGDGTGTFSQPVVYPVDAYPISLIAVHRGNGVLDLATANYESSSVSVLRNAGGGFFQQAQTYPVGNQPKALVAADFGNGHVDLAVGNAESGTITILLGKGNGTFRVGNTYSFILIPGDLVAADFGNGHVDLAAISVLSNSVTVLMGNGDGTFGQTRGYPVGPNPDALVAGDFGNGRIDLATANSGSTAGYNGSVSVLLNNGDGTFANNQIYPVGSSPIAFVAADLGNGHPDIVTADSVSNTISVLMGNGDGTFRSALSFAVGNGPDAIVTGDFNGDGRPDIAVANGGSNTVSVLLGNGDGSFQQAAFYTVGVNPVSLVVGDFGNGQLDLATANGDGTVSVLLGNGDGTFAATADSYLVGIASSNASAGPNSLVAADLGNGHLDLAVADGVDGTVVVLLGNGDGTFLAAQPYAVGPDPVGLIAANLGNGQIDLAVANSTSNTISVLLGDGTGQFQPQQTYVVGFAPYALVAADFGNGLPDLAVANRGTINNPGSTVSVLLGSGGGLFQLAQPYIVGSAPGALVATDFGNGHPDLAVVNRIGGTVSVLLGTGTGTFPTIKNYSVGDGLTAILPIDLGNQHIDLIVNNGLGNSVSVLLGKGDGTFLSGAAANAQQATPLLADLNGDDTLDAVVVNQDGTILYRPGNPQLPGTFDAAFEVNLPSDPARAAAIVATSGGYLIAALDVDTNTVSLYRRNADNTFTRVGTLAVGNLATRIVAGNLSGDADGLSDDLVVLNSGDGTVTVIRSDNSGGFLTPPPISVGLGASSLALGPGTSGAPDIFVSNAIRGDVAVLVNNGSGNFATLNRFRAGAGPYGYDASAGTVQSSQATDGLVAADFTGDGKTDVIAINPGSDSYANLIGIGGGNLLNPVTHGPLGFGPGLIVAGTFDRKANSYQDIAVLDPASGTVYVYVNSGTGSFRKSDTQIVGTDATGLSVADVNKDGLPDLVIGNRFGDLLVLLGNGNGTFRAFDASNTVALAVAHLSSAKPGRDDFVYASQALDHVSVQYGGAAPAVFQGRKNGILSPGAARLVDLNGDGRPDLVVADSARNIVLVYPGLANGKFGTELNGGHGFAVGDDPVGITVGDVKGNGTLGLVVANHGSNDVSILYVQPSGSSFTLTPGPRIKTGGQGPTSTVIHSVAGAGIPDILASNSGSNNVTLMPGVGNGFFKDGTQSLGVGLAPQQLVTLQTPTGAEFATINSGSNDISTFIFNSSLGQFQVQQTISSGGNQPVSALALDLPGSAFSDLVVANQADGIVSLLVGGAGGLSLKESVTLDNADSLSVISDARGTRVYGNGAGEESAILLFNFGIAGPVSIPEPPSQQVASVVSLQGSNLPIVVVLLSVSSGNETAVDVAGVLGSENGGLTPVPYGASRDHPFTGGGVDSGTELEDGRIPASEDPTRLPEDTDRLPLFKFIIGTQSSQPSDEKSPDVTRGDPAPENHPSRVVEIDQVIEAPAMPAVEKTTESGPARRGDGDMDLASLTGTARVMSANDAQPEEHAADDTPVMRLLLLSCVWLLESGLPCSNRENDERETKRR